MTSIVCPDTDVSHAVSVVVSSAMGGAGQNVSSAADFFTNTKSADLKLAPEF